MRSCLQWALLQRWWSGKALERLTGHFTKRRSGETDGHLARSRAWNPNNDHIRSEGFDESVWDGWSPASSSSAPPAACFEEVPASLLEQEAWKTVIAGAWKKDEGIVLTEARAAVMSLRRVCRGAGAWHMRHLLLVDNMAVCLSMERSRARHFPLLNQIRKMSALCLGCDVNYGIRWIPSEHNPADLPSRLATSKAPSGSMKHGPKKSACAPEAPVVSEAPPDCMVRSSALACAETSASDS